jgi:archaellum biogenesis protein FlaJ (TadC family)
MMYVTRDRDTRYEYHLENTFKWKYARLMSAITLILTFTLIIPPFPFRENNDGVAVITLGMNFVSCSYRACS